MMESSNESVKSDISVTGSSIKHTSSLEISIPRSIPWRKLTPKSSAGVTRIKSSSFLHDSSQVKKRRNSNAKLDPSSFIVNSRTPVTTPQQLSMSPPSVCRYSSSNAFYLTQGYEEGRDFVSIPKMGKLSREQRKSNPTQFDADSVNSDSSSQTFPPLSSLLPDEYDHIRSLDESLVDDPPCSNSLICAFESLTTTGLRSPGSRRGITFSHTQPVLARPSHSARVVQEAVAVTKRHFVTNRVEYEDGDGAKLSYQKRLSITPHQKGVVMCLPEKRSLLSNQSKQGSLWCMPKPDRGYKPACKSTNGKRELVVSEQYHQDLTWQNSMREQTLSPWTSFKKL